MKTFLALILSCLSFIATAAPLAVLDDNGLKITVYDEPCEITNLVTNLPFKATWQEGKKEFKGCYGASPISAKVGLVMFFFEDKTVAVIPTAVFVQVKAL